MRVTSSPIPLIAQREIRQRLRSRAFFVFTALIAVAIVGIAVLNRALSDNGPTAATVVVTGQAPPALDATLAAAGDARNLRVDVVTAPDRAAAVSALDGGTADAAIVVPAGSQGELLFRRRVNSDLQSTVASAWQVSRGAELASQLGVQQGDISEILNPTPLHTVTIEPESAQKGVAQLVGTLAAILLFISVSTFGGFVLTGVVEEKTTAVIEILLAQVRAHQLLAGKVLGIGTVALVQFVTAVAASIVALRISGASIPSAVWVAVPSTIGWFVAGFALYSTLFALAGSFVSRQEDAQAAAAPISMIFLAAYLVVFSVSSDPGGSVATVLSIIPFFAPLLMPLRIASGVAPVWQIVLSAVLLVGTAYAVIRVAGRVYARTLLHRGSRVRWKQALRLSSS
jgi:ABC-2 type transport system permease protein